MEVTETQNEGLKRAYTVVVPATAIQGEIEARIAELGRTIEIKGFRKGKVPTSLIRKKYASSVLGEVLEHQVNHSSRDVMSERELRPAMQPKIEITKFAEGDDLEYTMELEVLPEIDPGDLSKLTLTRLAVTIDDAELDKALERLVEQEKRFEPVSEPRAAASGEMVVIDFAGTIDGEPIENGTAENFELELGSNALIPGFEEQLIGAKAGDSVTVTATFPDEYPAEAMAGKTAVFAVEVKELREPVKAVLDEAFAERRGMESVEKLKEAVRTQMQSEYDSLARERLKRELFDHLAAEHDFALPQSMVEHEFEHVWSQLTEEMKRTEKSFEDIDQSEEEVRAEYQGITERRIRLGLLLAEIGRTNDIQVNQNELMQAALRRAMSQFPGQEQKVLEFYKENPEALDEFHGPIYEEKAVDFILAKATVTDKPSSIEDLLAPPEAAEEPAKPAKKAAASKKPAAKKASAAKKAPAKKKATAAKTPKA